MNQNLPQRNFTAPELILQPILENGMQGLPEAIAMLLNEAMKIERENALQAHAYERTEYRLDYANGFKNKKLNTRFGEVNLQIPQTRNCDFYPGCLERGLRSERAIFAAMAQMYIQGVSTRKVTKVLESLCGLEVSSSQVSRVTALLDEELEVWRNRPLGKIEYMLLDARYEKVRSDRSVRDCALLTAYGVDESGKRTVLGVSVELSEAEVHWRKFLESITARGIHGLKLIVSDNHKGLQKARKAVFSSVPWQRCQFHLQQNASAYIPKKSMQSQVHADIKAIFNAKEKSEAERLLQRTADFYQDKAADLAEWLEENIPEGLTVFDFESFSESQRKKLRTTNMVEFQNKELKKRTRLIRVFPNKDSLLRIASAMLVEIDEKWQSDDRAYIARNKQ